MQQDQILLTVDEATFNGFIAALDAPRRPRDVGLERFMAVPAPWVVVEPPKSDQEARHVLSRVSPS